MILGRNSCSGVAHRHLDSIPSNAARHLDDFLIRLIHSVTGIGQQIDEDLFQLNHVAQQQGSSEQSFMDSSTWEAQLCLDEGGRRPNYLMNGYRFERG